MVYHGTLKAEVVADESNGLQAACRHSVVVHPKLKALLNLFKKKAWPQIGTISNGEVYLPGFSF
jgi:hypothetical protein